jgi:L-ascorbate metabolism protein UlaG (beta-lactamase superfamily)
MSLKGALYRSLFPRWRPKPELRPTGRAGGEGLTVRWLGTAAHLVETATTTLLIDPFFSRPGLVALAGKLRPDEEAIRWRLPATLDAVLCGHSHFDHLLDAPRIARLTGAKLVGSASTLAFGRAEGVSESQLVAVPPEGRALTVGDIEVRFVPSRHGRILFGRVPFPGEVSAPPTLPVRFWHYRMGGAFGLLLRGGGVTLYHNGSADLVDAELSGASADVVLAGLAGRRATPAYLERLLGLLSPKVVVPTHHDAFFAPLDEGVHLLPGIDLEGFAREARGIAPRAAVITPDYGEALFIPAGEARGAVLHG